MSRLVALDGDLFGATSTMTMNNGQANAAVPPILMSEPGDLHAFDSVDEAERDLEAIDVKNGIYKGFDATGRLLRLGVRSERSKFLGFMPVVLEFVVVSLAEETPSHREELATILARFLCATGDTGDAITRMTFEELVAKASQVSNAIR